MSKVFNLYQYGLEHIIKYSKFILNSRELVHEYKSAFSTLLSCESLNRTILLLKMANMSSPEAKRCSFTHCV